MIVELIQRLPSFVSYCGYEFELYIIQNHWYDIRVLYKLYGYHGPDVKKKALYKTGGWVNRFYLQSDNSPTKCDFLFMIENISSDKDLVAALNETYAFLLKNRLLPIGWHRLIKKRKR